jgi:chloramphenicol O-acetyltransferase type A
MKASNAVKEFRYRVEEGKVFVYDVIHASPTISRGDGTFGFAQVDFHEDFDVFQERLDQEIVRVKTTTGLFTAPERIDVIHYSALPWFSFTGLTHPRNYNDGDSIPKISFGRIFKHNSQRMLPLSLLVHHGLIDGYHVGLYVEAFKEFLNS